jgi:hypothetical protein
MFSINISPIIINIYLNVARKIYDSFLLQGTDVFEVDPTTGVVTVAKPIDREAQSGISDNEIR